jgi:CDP-diacylglycerol--glycerol-3-phosphate 3-phosphatidyltransferase
MLNVLGRGFLERVLDPVGRRLARAGVSPDAITVAGMVGVVASSVLFTARGHLLLALIGITLSALTDMLDGAVARALGRASRWGAFLDSTLDRVADAAIFGCLAYWLLREDRPGAGAAALVCLAAGALVSYAKARAEGLGLTCNVGIAERGERLALVGVGGFLEILDVPYAIDVVLWVLAGLTVVTIGQRMWTVRVQTRGERARPGAAESADLRPPPGPPGPGVDGSAQP